MILDKPTLQNVLELVQEEGCPACGELPSHVSISGPDEVRLGCGQVIDAKEWNESHYKDRDLDRSLFIE